jgi:hypothetical protein
MRPPKDRLTPKERAVIAGAIRWNELRGGEPAPFEQPLLAAVEALVNTRDLATWQRVLDSYDGTVSANAEEPEPMWTLATFAKACNEAEDAQLSCVTVPIRDLRLLFDRLTRPPRVAKVDEGSHPTPEFQERGIDAPAEAPSSPRKEAAAMRSVVEGLAEARDLAQGEWRDQPLPEDDSIDAAHPLRSGRHDLYAEAMRLVGARQSKGAPLESMGRLSTIDTYTARWDEAMRPTAPEVGDRFCVDAAADAREWDAFQKCLFRAGLDLEFVEATDDNARDIYEVIRRFGE